MHVEVLKTFVENFFFYSNLCCCVVFVACLLIFFFFFSGLVSRKSVGWSPWDIVFFYQPVHSTRLNSFWRHS